MVRPRPSLYRHDAPPKPAKKLQHRRAPEPANDDDPALRIDAGRLYKKGARHRYSNRLKSFETPLKVEISCWRGNIAFLFF
jgi:hypothetical protein